VVGRDVRELVSRSIFMCQNAQFQLQAHMLGKVVPLSSGETRLAGTINSMPNVVGRTWEYWSMRLDLAGLAPPRSAAARKPAQSKRRPAARPSARGKAAGRKRARR
jgi:hypothetical protein